MQALRQGVSSEPDAKLVLRALALLDVEATRAGRPDHESTWRAMACELDATDEPWAAWHVWMAGAAGLTQLSATVAFEEACQAAIEVAVERGLPRAGVWSCLELAQHLRALERPAEADTRLSGALELAERLGDAVLLDLVLRVGTDVAAELGQGALLVERLRLRASVAAELGQPGQRAGLLHQAFLAAKRACLDGAGSLGEELAEAVLGTGLGLVPGLEMEPLLHELVAVDAVDHARRLALAASQFAFRGGRRAEAAERLVDAARFALLLDEREEARAMFDEAIQVSQAYGLGLHGRWLDERRDRFGS